MRTFLRFSRKVHFPASVRANQRRWPRLGPPLRAFSSSRILPIPITVEAQPLCRAEQCTTHGELFQQHALWLVSLRPWAASISRRLGLRGTEVDDAVQSAFTDALSSWGSFLPSAAGTEANERRMWIGKLVWRAAAKVRSQRNRGHLLANPDLLHGLPHAATPSDEARIVAWSVLGTLQQATTPERWRIWSACKVEHVPVAEVARREGRPSSTIYNLVRLAQLDFLAAARREDAAAAGPLVSRHPRRVRH